jgi:adenosylhomocysteine nucleosidase
LGSDAGGGGAPSPRSPPASGGEGWRLGVVVGLAAEARIARPLGWRVAIGGGTASGAMTAAQRLINEGSDALVSFGLAGGLDPALRPGALIVPCAIIVDDARYRTDPRLSCMLGGVTPHTLAGADAIAVGVEDKRRLRCRASAAAVDLESGSVARAAVARGIPFAVLRAICDPAERTLPAAALAALDARGVIGFWRVITSLAVRPGQLPVLLAQAVDAVAARRSLVERVRQITRASV